MSKPFVPKSTVDWVERAREARGEPAPPDAVAVGALNQLIGVLRAAAAPWRAAGDHAAGAELTETISREADAIAGLAGELDATVRELGGSAPTAAEGAGELPRLSADFEYAQSDREVEAMLAENRSRLAAACDRALESDAVEGAARRSIEETRARFVR